jgi:hypothetical protein
MGGAVWDLEPTLFAAIESPKRTAEHSIVLKALAPYLDKEVSGSIILKVEVHF